MKSCNARIMTAMLIFSAMSPVQALEWIAVQGKDSKQNLQIFLIHPDGTDRHQLTFAYITPDPRSPAGFNPEIWRINRDGSGLRLVTTTNPDNARSDGSFLNTAHDANAPDFGPGGWIAFWSGEETSWGQVWKIKEDGIQRIQLTSTGFLSRNDDPTWSPDGTKILFSTDRNGGNEVWVMDSDGSNPRYLTKNAAGPYPGDPSWQPNRKTAKSKKAIK